MNRTSIRSRTAFRAAATACAAVLGVAGNAASQGVVSQTSDLGLVVKIRSEIVAPGPGGDARNEAMQFLAFLMDLANTFETPGNAELIQDAADALEPQTWVQDYVVSVKGDRMRVDMGGSSLLARLAPDGSVAEWGILDPRSGRVLESSNLFDAGVRANPYSALDGAVEIDEPEIVAKGETRQILGYTARRHEYSYSVLMDPVGRGEKGTSAVVLVAIKGEAWIAPDDPGVDRDVAAFFRTWGESFGNQGAGGLGDRWLQDRGLLLATTDSTVVAVVLRGSVGWSFMTASTSFEVTDISRQPLDDALLSGFERREQKCDCSCGAWAELQALGKMSRKEQEAHPRAMTLSMCVRECGATWGRCDRDK